MNIYKRIKGTLLHEFRATPEQLRSKIYHPFNVSRRGSEEGRSAKHPLGQRGAAPTGPVRAEDTRLRRGITHRTKPQEERRVRGIVRSQP